MKKFTLLFCCIVALPAFALVPFHDNFREILPAPFDGHPPVHLELLNTPQRLSYLDGFPGWLGIPNKYNGKAYRAFGEGILIPGWSDERVSAEKSVRRFIDERPEIFGVRSKDLWTAVFDRRMNLWFVILVQTANGIRIDGARLDMRISHDGKLFLFGDQTYPKFDGVFPKGLEDSELIFRAGSALQLDYELVEVIEQSWLPVEDRDGRLQIFPVKRIDFTVPDPASKWACYVDITTGETVMRVNKYSYLNGTINALVEVAPVAPWNTVLTRSVKWGTVTHGSNSGVSDTTGYYSFASSGTNNAIHRLTGPYLTVNDVAGAEPYFSQSVSGTSTLNILMNDSNSGPEERDAYVWAMRTLWIVKTMDPSFTGMDVATGCNVNVSGTCNAFWNGTSINFYPAGGGCQNTARLKDVVMHEYTHGIADKFYSGTSLSPSGAMNEAWSDFLPCSDAGVSTMGRGFTGAYSYIRNLDNTMVYPDDWTGAVHNDGLILGGALWDLRLNLSSRLPYVDTLSHFAKYGRPSNFTDYYYDILAVDDNDANLLNGTPNYCQIADAFGQHGIGSGTAPMLSHTPYPNTTNTTIPYVINASVLQCPASSWSAESILVRWSINGTTWNTAVMATTGGTNYSASIPPQPAGTVVRYGVIVKDNSGHQIIDPPRWPMVRHIFAIGSQITVVFDDFESDRGWVSGATGDDATTGQWVREDPYETYSTSSGLIYQSGDDHTPAPGVRCWVTGNAPMSYGAGYADVDGGRVSLVSPTFDLSTYIEPVLVYWRWFTNETSLDDSFWVYASSNGGSTWALVEFVPATENRWTEMKFVIRDKVSLSSNMRFKFVATDYRSGSLTEGMIDDFGIYAYVAVGVEEENRMMPEKLSISAHPNPFNATIALKFSVEPERVTITDILGNKVAELLPSTEIKWDARDAGGSNLPNGIYFVKATKGDESVVRKITFMK